MEIGFQRFDVLFESLSSMRGDGTDGAGTFAGHTFFDGNISGGSEFVELYAQITGGRFGFLPEINKIGFLDIHQNGHHGKA